MEKISSNFSTSCTSTAFLPSHYWRWSDVNPRHPCWVSKLKLLEYYATINFDESNETMVWVCRQKISYEEEEKDDDLNDDIK